MFSDIDTVKYCFSLDGLLGAPRVSKNGTPLPPPRIVSLKCAEIKNDHSPRHIDKKFETVMVMQMGQYIDHDITHSPCSPTKKRCCNPDGSFPSIFQIYYKFQNNHNIIIFCFQILENMIQIYACPLKFQKMTHSGKEKVHVWNSLDLWHHQTSNALLIQNNR